MKYNDIKINVIKQNSKCLNVEFKTLMYGTETMELSQNLQMKLLASEMDF